MTITVWQFKLIERTWRKGPRVLGTQREQHLAKLLLPAFILKHRYSAVKPNRMTFTESVGRLVPHHRTQMDNLLKEI
ncbi:hypothetical protein [Enterobacter hormaechei]|uniref:hypothetical protein n=1 Tax=Enterobacter hormaechei TaxID=158836 RepID=UPI002175F981|nr:hypothetical protein [Enterobacter hormaechei]UVZ93278.1 hypothetical protein M5T14_22280 [Enterobacter hormaechei]